MATETITGNESLEELQRLLEIMQKRLTIIEEKKSQTRPEIYAKVRAEYVANIEKIQNLMLEKGADLEEALNQAVVDRDTLNARKQELRDILDEMELRLAIGEIDEATKAQQSQEHLEEMEEIEGKLASLEEKINNYQKLMQASARPVKAPAQTAAIKQPVPPTMAPPVKPQTIAAAGPKPEPRPTPPPMAPPAPPQPVMPKPQPKPAASIPEPATKISGLAPRPQGPIPKPGPKPQAPSAPAPVVQTTPEPMAPAAPANEIDELEKQFASILGESLGQASGAEAQTMPDQTMPQIAEPNLEEPSEESHEGEIKCPKCGSFNRADNWYCEKCGNELISAQDLLGK